MPSEQIEQSLIEDRDRKFIEAKLRGTVQIIRFDRNRNITHPYIRRFTAIQCAVRRLHVRRKEGSPRMMAPRFHTCKPL